MSKIKNGGLDQYCAELFKQQQFGTAGVERVNLKFSLKLNHAVKIAKLARSLPQLSYLYSREYIKDLQKLRVSACFCRRSSELC